MDRLLAREEVKELMNLIGLSMACWGNLPLMQQKIRLACKKYHPDKGGDPEKMQRLNVLKEKLNATLRDQMSSSPTWCFSSEVSDDWGIPLTVGEFLGPEFHKKKVWDFCLCVQQGISSCKCLHCLLKKEHKKQVEINLGKPTIWGKCWCYKCYCLWFGLPVEADSFMWWTHIIYQSPLDWLGITEKLIWW
uniref:Small T antigen n=1 Tax=Human polyomavirus 6 TaxID=746830 RepID=A0A0F6QPP4_9POLY|nr:small T antigen [Human polyomavirus 6]